MENSAGVCYPRPFSYLRFIFGATAIGATLVPAFVTNFLRMTEPGLKALNIVMIIAVPVAWLWIYWAMAQNYRRITPGRTPDVPHFIAWGVVQLALLLTAAWLVSIGLAAWLQKP